MLTSEDEFVVLLEHAGLVDSFDDSEQEYVDSAQLMEWLEFEGVELVTARFRTNRWADETEKDDTTNKRMAQHMLASMLDKKWITAVPSDSVGDESQPQLFALRMNTTDAYRIYIEKDTESSFSSHSWNERTLLDLTRDKSTGVSTPGSSISSHSEPSDAAKHMQLREKMWVDCFPTCSESCRQIYFSFESPTLIMYSTLGLNLIGNGISSVPAFSRELKNMGISHEDRTVIVGFLARAFPCE